MQHQIITIMKYITHSFYVSLLYKGFKTTYLALKLIKSYENAILYANNERFLFPV